MPFTSDGKMLHRPVSDYSSNSIVCHEAVGQSSLCRPGLPILAAQQASLQHMRPVTRYLSRSGFLVTNDASDQQLVLHMLIQYFIVLKIFLLRQQRSAVDCTGTGATLGATQPAQSRTCLMLL